MPAYSHIKPQECPVCHKQIKNFMQHTRTRLPLTEQDKQHIKLRLLHNQQFNELLEAAMIQQSATKLPLLSDSGVATALNQKAWDQAIEIYRRNQQ